jgi:hypothetical protein
VIIRRRWLVVLFCVFIVLGAAAAYLYWSPNVYRVSNLIVIDQTTGLEMKDIFIFLGDGDLLSKMKYKSDLDSSVLDKILDFKASPFKKKGVQNANAIQVDVLTVDENAGVSFIGYLPRYIQTRPLITSKLEDSKRRIRRNIADLQSFRDNPLKALHISGSPVIIGPELYSIYEKYNQNVEMLEKLEKLQIVRLAGDTYIPMKPYKPKKAMIIVAGLLIGLLFGLCSAFVMERISGSPRRDDPVLKTPASM